jgi:hypothetical protein
MPVHRGSGRLDPEPLLKIAKKGKGWHRELTVLPGLLTLSSWSGRAGWPDSFREELSVVGQGTRLRQLCEEVEVFEPKRVRLSRGITFGVNLIALGGLMRDGGCSYHIQLMRKKDTLSIVVELSEDEWREFLSALRHVSG